MILTEQKILGVKIDYVTMDQVLENIVKWLEKKKKHYIVTPNPEMIVDSLSDSGFRIALNKADLGIADSPRLGWASKVLKSKHLSLRLIYLPFLLFPQIILRKQNELPQLLSGREYPTTSGTDLMEKLINLSEEKGYITAYLGGSPEVAEKLLKCLRAKHPNLKIAFCSGNIQIDDSGKSRFDIQKYKMTKSKEIKYYQDVIASEKRASQSRLKTVLNQDHYVANAARDDKFWRNDKFNPHTLSQKIDILFVAFGHKKQEKWMHQNLPKLNAAVMIGVGGAFDYFSGSVPRAPEIMRKLGLEWLFRVMVQPWRIKRFWKLPVFVYKVMTLK